MSKTKTLFYFGYGSNMSTQYLIKRRKITPLESQVAHLKDYELIMNMEGPNFLEPSFANIRFSEGSTVEGVIHKINDKDLQKIVNTEGEDYKLVKLSVYIAGKRKTAYTLIYITEEKKDIPPSKRYLRILINAAKENKLSRPYIENLEKRPNVYYPVLSEVFSLRVYLWVWLRT
tara:strand:+ start:422 stop:943 length:522 start_codon:yes stop_codon:yes gene_type:complete